MTEQSVPADKERWYFTFGVANPIGNRVVIVDGEWMDARQEIMNVFGRDFAFQYSPTEFHNKSALSGLLVTTLDTAAILYKKATEGMKPNHLSDIYGLSQSQGCE